MLSAVLLSKKLSKRWTLSSFVRFRAYKLENVFWKRQFFFLCIFSDDEMSMLSQSISDMASSVGGGDQGDVGGAVLVFLPGAPISLMLDWIKFTLYKIFQKLIRLNGPIHRWKRNFAGEKLPREESQGVWPRVVDPAIALQDTSGGVETGDILVLAYWVGDLNLNVSHVYRHSSSRAQERERGKSFWQQTLQSRQSPFRTLLM